MFDFEPFIIDFCDDCGTRHAPIRECPFEKAFQEYVVNNYYGSDSEPIGREWFREEIWNERKNET
mgnify:CR=1 FL=1